MTQLGSPATESGQGDGGGGQAVRGSRLARRRRVLFWVAGGAALLAIGGLIGSAFVKSPQQIAADTAAPPPTATTARVVSQVLTSSVQMRGVVYPAAQYDVYPSAPEADAAAGTGSAAGGSATGSGSAAGSGSAGSVYISGLHVAAGKTVSNGEKLAEIDGEPLFALAGRVPAWRDMTPGESGPDVAELQRALASLGYYADGDTPGFFGAATQEAVSVYYEHLGYTPPATGGVPVTDVIFLPSLPAKVVAVNGGKGQQPGQPFLELAARGSLALTGELPPGYAAQVKPGLKVKIFDEVTGIHAAGTVASVGTATTVAPVGAVVNVGGGSPAVGSAGAAGSGAAGSGAAGTAGAGNSGSGASPGAAPFIPLAVHPSRPLPAALDNENVLVTVETGRTEGPVLTVPVAAIVTTGSGTSYVTVAGAHGRQTQVAVTPGISENGYVQVTPAAAGRLAAGDRVVVSG